MRESIFLRKKYDYFSVKTSDNIKSIIYGGLDGAVTTFAVIAGVTGASLSIPIVIITGFSNIIADGISLGIGDYLGTKAKNEHNQKQRRDQYREIKKNPLRMKEELIKRYVKRGMAEKEAREVVDLLAKKPKVWLDAILSEEFDANIQLESPIKSGFLTFSSFVLFGLIPILPYILSLFFHNYHLNSFFLSAFFTTFSLGILGIFKARLSDKKIVKSVFETVFIGALAAISAYIIGYLLSVAI